MKCLVLQQMSLPADSDIVSCNLHIEVSYLKSDVPILSTGIYSIIEPGDTKAN
jgi:hypothetical protein